MANASRTDEERPDTFVGTAIFERIITRLHKLTGPDRHMDGEIFKAVEERPGDVWEQMTDDDVWHRRDKDDACAWDGPPAYTASLDSAILLIPAGHAWSCGLTEGSSGGKKWVDRPFAYVGLPFADPEVPLTYAKSCPVALCMAALYARV